MPFACEAIAPAGRAYELSFAGLDVGAEAVSAAMAMLSEDERLRACRFVFDRDRRRFAMARAGLRERLADRLGRTPEAVELGCGANGKPMLKRRCGDPDLRFNVSHSEDVAVYAFAHGREIGVDIEALRHVADADEVATRFFSRREAEAYRGLDPRDRQLGFFNCWTRKEAFVKALGDGLNFPLDRFDVSLAPGEPARLLRLEGTHSDVDDWLIEGFTPVCGFVAAVVVEVGRGSRAPDGSHEHCSRIAATGALGESK